jgi:hypothetical protein
MSGRLFSVKRWRGEVGISRGGPRRKSGIALVITLLMLSVITFLAVAFLVTTRTRRTSVSTSLDQNTAKEASDAALNRAQAEIIGQMMANQDILSYDYMASRNFTGSGFTNTEPQGIADVNNVNYDRLSTGALFIHNPTKSATEQWWAQNIANLMYDPRPPVFVQTNSDPGKSDFRFWVDLNRNGMFEGTSTTNQAVFPGQWGGPDPNGNITLFNVGFGEPEWIGGLQYPNLPHSATNRFLMRYAYLVAPIGKTLDLNYIHNYAQRARNASLPANMNSADGFMRDQGVGSWELNLGAYLREINTNYYVNYAASAGLSGPYNYQPYSGNTGWCFRDALSLTAYRYNSSYSVGLPQFGFPQSTPALLFLNGVNYFENDNVDEYAVGGPTLFTSFYPTNDVDAALPASSLYPWPGGNTSNKYYDLTQDLFDTNKSIFAAGTNNRLPMLAWAGTNTDTYDRYTFQRLLASLGTSSVGTGFSADLETYVYDPGITNYTPATLLPASPFSYFIMGTNIYQSPPTVFRPKVNLNYDNSTQIAASRPGPASTVPSVGPRPGQNTSPTNLTYWSQLSLFTNAADVLLRSQEFVLTNQICVNNTISNAYIHFGVNAIPIYNSTNAAVRYNSHIHRMLQLAANVVDAAMPRFNSPAANGATNVTANGVLMPSVFRPIFLATNINGVHLLYIVGFANDVQDGRVVRQALFSNNAFRDPSDPNIQPNDTVWGVPWIVGAVKGLPEFNQYSYATEIDLERKLQFSLRQPQTPPQYTNQFYLLSVSNVFGADLWNSYKSAFPDGLLVLFSNCVSFTVTNSTNGSLNWSTNIIFTNFLQTGISADTLPGWPGGNSSLGFSNILTTNVQPMSLGYFSPTKNAFLSLNSYPSFLPADKSQGAFPTYPWFVNVTNRVCFALIDTSARPVPRVIDFVNLGPFGTSLDIFGSINRSPNTPPPPTMGGGGDISVVTDAECWNQAPSPIAGMSMGVYNQMQIAMGKTHQGLVDGAAATNFVNNLSGHTTNLSLSFDCPLQPSIRLVQRYDLEAADPLVHYTLEDLTSPQLTNVIERVSGKNLAPLALTNSGSVTRRYMTAKGIANSRANPLNNMTFVDPGLTTIPGGQGDLRSDFWNFPTNKFPSIGWLGRVHRGTPWQTVFLKADANPQANGATWLSQWTPNYFNYPTNDYSLIDLFTAAPNDNAATGLLSINQTNQAAWSALLSGIIVFANGTNAGFALGPTNVTGNQLVPDITYMLDSTNGVNATRALGRNGLFHRLGEILGVPTLTTTSPYTLAAVQNGTASDDLVERIPIQTLGLMKVGQPQFVIYAWGQALRPKDLYLGGGPNFNLCTNYQITAEYLSRTVCHVVGEPFATNSPVIEIDSKTTEP